MKSTQAALVFTGGYLVGRRLNMRWAVALAGLTAGRHLLFGQGRGQAQPSGLGQLGQELRSELMTVGRSAAMTTMSNRMNSLSDLLEEQASALRGGPNGQEPDESSSQRDEAPGDEAEARKGRQTEGRSGAGRSKTTAGRPAEREKQTGAGASGRSRG